LFNEKEEDAMGLLRALGRVSLAYFVILVALVLMPLLLLFFLWTALCVFSSLFLFAFWLFFTHQPHTLYSALYMAAWGLPPCLAASVLGYYADRLRARQEAPLVTLNGGVPFQ
jgi:hypothetical protein